MSFNSINYIKKNYDFYVLNKCSDLQTTHKFETICDNLGLLNTLIKLVFLLNCIIIFFEFPFMCYKLEPPSKDDIECNFGENEKWKKTGDRSKEGDVDMLSGNYENQTRSDQMFIGTKVV